MTKPKKAKKAVSKKDSAAPAPAPAAKPVKLDKSALKISPVLGNDAKVEDLPLKDVFVGKNVRSSDPKWAQKVSELANNIASQGQLQPVLVSPMKAPGPRGEKFNLEFGFRRYHAMKQLKETSIRAIIAPEMSSLQSLAVKLGENHGRADLAPLDEAHTIQEMISAGVAPADVAAFLGVTEGYISQRRALLKLTEPVQDALKGGKITATHARELARVKDPVKQEKMLTKAEGMNAQEFKDHVDNALGSTPKPRKQKPAANDASGKRVVRTSDDVARVLKRASEAVKTAKETGLKEDQVAYIKGFAKGIMWRERPDVKAPV
jgi:ParB/RepB/Spo0J family partition protein